MSSFRGQVSTYYKDGKEIAFQKQNEKNLMLWNLLDEHGKINRNGVEYLRKTYAAEIASPPAKEAVIHLKWKKETSSSGWQWNAPDENDEGTLKKETKKPDAPVTKP